MKNNLTKSVKKLGLGVFTEVDFPEKVPFVSDFIHY